LPDRKIWFFGIFLELICYRGRITAVPVITSVAVTADTVTTLVAVLLPFCVVAVMVAVPAPTGVTTPSTTVATAALLVVQVTTRFVASEGANGN